MNRHVTSLPIPNHLKTKLVKNGIESVTELKNLRPTDLIKGGLPLGKISELCGAAGVGKTQVCMQLCVNVQIPEVFGGLGAKAIYIDTEGSFMSNRVVEIFNATGNLLKQNFNLNNRNELIKHNFTIDKILSNIFYYRCVDHVQLLACFNNIKILMEKHPQIKLVVIDSLAYPFRFVDFKDSNSMTMKTNILNNIMSISYELINKYNIAILVTNQMTTRITRDVMSNLSSSNLVPALGETWAHSANLRILLSWKNSKRQASVCKSSYLPDTSIFYKITERGFEDEFLENDSNDTIKNNTNAFLNDSDFTNAQIKRKKFDD
ncbi:unnamed protein product [Brachionus calyciflorus]|uniref:DNA repair protein RAD51 homolog 3 n=1 Tax=Brachionus calyciflorus TaxID=104777 RepID=A0A813X6G6_9BILA|nr:unnamed protein product [Brachionus calyciflorus]